MAKIDPKILTICLLLMFNAAHTQEIWRESFSVAGKGIMGDGKGGIHSDFSGVRSWTLEYSSLELADEGDYAKTVSTSGGRFEACDIDGEVTWRSEWINISKFEKVNIELTASETGSGANTQTKYLKAFYKLDNKEEFPFSENSENVGNWGSVKVIANDLSGNALQIVCYISNHYAADKVILDEVVVKAKEKYFSPAQPGELLLSEILFNPFPEGEDYVEIYNNSEREIPLGKLFLASRDKKLELVQTYELSGPKYLIYPKSYLAITMDTNKVFPYFHIKCRDCFQQVPKIASFNNDDDYVVLLNEDLEVLDEFHYNEKMHSTFLSDVEGISLERISFKVPANMPGNWHSSSSGAGYGTPGYENSQGENDYHGKPAVVFEQESFSPNYDGYNDEFIIQYETAKPGYTGNIKIFNAAGYFIQNLAKNDILGTSGKYTWDGTDETGNRQAPGVYVVLVEIFNADGEVHRYKKGIVLTEILK